MKIKDIPTSNLWQRIKLGAKNGNGFIFCGPVPDKETWNSIMEQLTDVYLQNLRSSYEKTLYESDEALKKSWERSVDFEIRKRMRAGWSEEQRREFYDKKSKKLKTEEAWKRFKKKRDMAQKRAKKRLDAFYPFLERPILETYHSTVPGNEDEYILIFDGLDNGEYWTDDEYREGRK